MAVYLTSDWHLRHTNILQYCNRPFRTIEEHDEAIIRTFNAVVGDDDLVWFLGDFSFRDPRPFAERLRGRWRFILGNHDKQWKSKLRQCPRFESVVDGPVTWEHGRHRVVLDHYYHPDWAGRNEGVVWLHGHAHGGSKPLYGRFDVGVDVWDFKPVSLDMAVACAHSSGRPMVADPDESMADRHRSPE